MTTNKVPVTSVDFRRIRCVLVHEPTGKPVHVGDKLKSSHSGDEYEVRGGSAPHKASSTGRVHVQISAKASAEFFPTVLECAWVPVDELPRFAREA
jgi:hypothetical protein